MGFQARADAGLTTELAASTAFGFSRAKGYDLVRRGEFPCRVLRIGRSTRVVTASLLRVLDSGEPEYSATHDTHPTPA
ncbi:hypothetical protein [Streptomyces sp. NPDC002746]